MFAKAAAGLDLKAMVSNIGSGVGSGGGGGGAAAAPAAAAAGVFGGHCGVRLDWLDIVN